MGTLRKKTYKPKDKNIVKLSAYLTKKEQDGK